MSTLATSRRASGDGVSPSTRVRLFPPAATPATGRRRPEDTAAAISATSAWPAIWGVVWLFVVGLAYLAPALAGGVHLGPYDVLNSFGLGTVKGTQLHGGYAADQIQQGVPWATLAWEQVHHGQLPLWDSYNGLGLPFAFNFQSAVFSLPMLVAYLFPVGLVYTVAIVVKLLIAGTGVFFLSRVMKMPVLAGVFAGTVFELSGAFTGWLGWPQAGTFCWLGWLLGGALLLLRGFRWTRMALFSLSLAMAIYGGHPESVLISLFTLSVILVIVVAARRVGKRSLRPARALLPLAGSAVLGLALAAPLLLPGLPLTSQSVRYSFPSRAVLPGTSAANLVFAGFSGFPVPHSVYFGAFDYYEAAAYVGLIPVVLAVLAVWRRWREPEVASLAAAAVVLAAIVYSTPVVIFVSSLPVAGHITWTRSLVPLDFLLAVLSGLGLEVLLRRGDEQKVRRGFAALATVGVIGLAAAFASVNGAHLSVLETGIRRHSFLWPAISAGAVVVAAGILFLHRRWEDALRWRVGRPGVSFRLVAGGLLALVEVGFLLTAAPQLWSSSKAGFTTTAAEAQLEKIVGSSRVGVSSCPSLTEFPDLGILPEANSAYGVSEIDVYEPTLPRRVLSAWSRASGQAVVPTFGDFCPSISSATLARQFGVTYVLGPDGGPAPSGTDFVTDIGGEALYRVPGAGLVTLASSTASDAPDQTAVAVSSPNSASFSFRIDPSRRSVVYIHTTNSPGWRATSNGRALTLDSWDGTMLRATVGPGRQRIVLTYRPRTFVLGIALAELAAAILVAGLVGQLAVFRRATRPAPPLLPLPPRPPLPPPPSALPAPPPLLPQPPLAQR